MRSRVGESQDEQHRDDGKEARSVDREGPRVATGGDDDPGERRADDPPEVPLRRRERDGTDELLLRDEVGEDRVEGREAERLGAAGEEHDPGDDPGRRRAGGGEEREDPGQHRLDARRREEQTAARPAIGECTAERSDERGGDEVRGGDESGPRRLARGLLHEDPDGHRFHPRADVGDERAAPQQGELSMAERCDGAGEVQRSRT